MKMENIKVYSESNMATGGAYIKVVADTERFGKSEVMYEGNTFGEVFEYLKRELGVDSLRINSSFIYRGIEDRKGQCFPCFMRIGTWA